MEATMGAVASALEKLKAPWKQSSVVTVRLPRETHERLREVAHEKRTSLNVLCVASLEAALNELEKPLTKSGG
jgi:predicted HicB family RNase H-like nuclease